MSQQHSNNQASHVTPRAVAHDHGGSGISQPAVSAAQTAEKVQEQLLAEPAVSREIKPFQLKPVNMGSVQEPAKGEDIPPFQPAGSGPVVQRKEIRVTTGKGRQRESGDVDHKYLIKQAGNGNLIPHRGRVDIGEDEPWIVPMDDLITAVKDASQHKNHVNIAGELTDLLNELRKIKEHTREKPVKRKNREEDDDDEEEDPSASVKKNKVDPRAKGPSKDAPEEEEESSSSPVSKPESMQLEDPSPKIKKPEEPLKFIAWNANHFGETGDLNEEMITRQIDVFNPQLIIRRLRRDKNKEDKENTAKATGFLQVMQQHTTKLPLFTDISAVNKLMQAAHELNLLLKKFNSSLYTERQKQVPDIIGSLKKHYMIEHSKHLMQVHSNLIMGFNEVGKGVEFMQQKLEEKSDGKDQKGGGIKLETGPKLQAISINVPELNLAIGQYNKTSARRKLKPVAKKDHQYAESDYYDQYSAYTTLGQPARLLRSSQIEYYPIAFNPAKYKYLGSIAVSTKGDELKQSDITWTKNPFLLAYIKFRPIVVHKLARKNADGNVSKDEIWYGMVHTSPKGDEFDRRKIYEQQLTGSLPKLKAMAKGMNAQLIIGGDYYIAEEALVSNPPAVRNVNSRAASATKDDVRMTTDQMSQANLNAGSPVGWSPFDKKLSTGKINEVRNLQHPRTKVPYNYKGALGGMNLQDTRSLTGTNSNEAGLQSADYFIVDPKTSKTFQTGVIDPLSGQPSLMESEDKDISNAWFSFSDHVPVMLVVSGEQDDKAVAKAFSSNRDKFNTSADNINPFDLRFLQLSNVIARLQQEKDLPEKEVATIKASFGEIQKKRQTGAYTEDDLVLMNLLKAEAEKLLDPKDRGQYISAAAFESSQGSNAYITTILYQVWTDLFELKPEGEGKKLLDLIQQVRMIIKEDKINAAYAIGLDAKHENERQLAALEIKPFLEEHQDKTAKLDTLYANIKRARTAVDVKDFIQLKSQLEQAILDSLMTKIDSYVSARPQTGEAEKYKNISSNSALIKDITGKKTSMSNVRSTRDKDVKDGADSSPQFFFPFYTPQVGKEGGIPNRGADCFLNSVLQLLSLPAYDSLLLDTEVRAFVGKIQRKEDIHEIEIKDLRSYLFFLDRLATMGGQEDAAELLGQLMSEINHQELPVLQQQLPQHQQLFTTTVLHTRTIDESTDMQHYEPKPKDAEDWGGPQKTTAQAPENVLSVPVTGAKGLIDWMNTPREYTHAPDYSNFNTIEWALVSGNWRSITKERERTAFRHLPQVLTISLKRFNKTDKIEGPFEMPPVFWVNERGQDAVVRKTYELQGFIYHQGESMKRGHYWAHRKDKEGNWSKAEDRKVEPSVAGDAHTEGTWLHDINNAYVYTYVLKPADPASSSGEQND